MIQKIIPVLDHSTVTVQTHDHPVFEWSLFGHNFGLVFNGLLASYFQSGFQMVD
jgi:hypothetical protein